MVVSYIERFATCVGASQFDPWTWRSAADCRHQGNRVPGFHVKGPATSVKERGHISEICLPKQSPPELLRPFRCKNRPG